MMAVRSPTKLGVQVCEIAPNRAPSIRGTQDTDSSQKVVTKMGPELHGAGTPHGRQVLS
jgi:hypothetical protein